eukprot:TRINITY_DN4425_c0_g4_i1.p1 TRINITY_DN4425_c0_g4~~TRINITY_DN4425_c0_g4_i1.p1  ORF type:complete len:675 (+),score=135.74 TRINITY_DN4425_c0_g4_i1:53-2026(+)
MVNLDDKVVRQRLLVDHDRLLRAACSKLKKADRNQTGLLSMSRFEDALRELGVHCGGREFDDLLAACRTTHDGYVNVRDLMELVSTPSRRRREALATRDLIARLEEPSEALPARCYTRERADGPSFLQERMQEIRAIFNKWSMFGLTDMQLKAQLQAIGFPPTDLLEDVLRTCGGGRELRFSRFLQAIQADDNDGRKCRNMTPRSVSPAPSTSFSSSAPRVRPNTPPPLYGRAQAEAERSFPDESSWDGPPPHSDAVTAKVRQAIEDFIDGRMAGPAFRHALGRLGVVLTRELERRIAHHERSSSGEFSVLLRLCLPQGNEPLGDSASVRDQRPFASGGGWEPYRRDRYRDGHLDAVGGDLRGASQPPPVALAAEALRPPAGEAPADRAQVSKHFCAGDSPWKPRRRTRTAESDYFPPRSPREVTSLAQGNNGEIMSYSAAAPTSCAASFSPAALCRQVEERPTDIGVFVPRARELTSRAQGDNGQILAVPRGSWAPPAGPVPRPKDADNYPRQRTQTEVTSRAQGTHGAILAQAQATSPRRPRSPRQTTSASMGRAPSRTSVVAPAPVTTGGFGGPAPARTRLRRQPSIPPVPAGEAAPYARVTDEPPRACASTPALLPFGTERDYDYLDPQDAGTDEFRGAIPVTPRRERREIVF